jgi:hypothetical protein
MATAEALSSGSVHVSLLEAQPVSPVPGTETQDRIPIQTHIPVKPEDAELIERLGDDLQARIRWTLSGVKVNGVPLTDMLTSATRENLRFAAELATLHFFGIKHTTMAHFDERRPELTEAEEIAIYHKDPSIVVAKVLQALADHRRNAGDTIRMRQ